jgi:hypothetical protein
MDGLRTLMAEGFNLAAAMAVDTAPTPPMAELLQWHAAADVLPDADRTVLMWVREPDGSTDWHAGWLDDDGWHCAASGGLVNGEVTHWAEPEGPQL